MSLLHGCAWRTMLKRGGSQVGQFWFVLWSIVESGRMELPTKLWRIKVIREFQCFDISRRWNSTDVSVVLTNFCQYVCEPIAIMHFFIAKKKYESWVQSDTWNCTPHLCPLPLPLPPIMYTSMQRRDLLCVFKENSAHSTLEAIQPYKINNKSGPEYD